MSAKSKLTHEQRMEIRRRALIPEKLSTIAKDFGIVPSTVTAIRDGSGSYQKLVK